MLSIIFEWWCIKTKIIPYSLFSTIKTICTKLLIPHIGAHTFWRKHKHMSLSKATMRTTIKYVTSLTTTIWALVLSLGKMYCIIITNKPDSKNTVIKILVFLHCCFMMFLTELVLWIKFLVSGVVADWLSAGSADRLLGNIGRERDRWVLDLTFIPSKIDLECTKAGLGLDGLVEIFAHVKLGLILFFLFTLLYCLIRRNISLAISSTTAQRITLNIVGRGLHW